MSRRAERSTLHHAGQRSAVFRAPDSLSCTHGSQEMSDGLSTNVGETWDVVLLHRVERHRIRRAHDPRGEDRSKGAPPWRRHPCSADSSKLHAGSAKAVPKSGPEIGPESVPLNGSTDSVWNRAGGQFLGSIGGLIFCLPRGKDPSWSRGRLCSPALGLGPIILLQRGSSSHRPVVLWPPVAGWNTWPTNQVTIRAGGGVGWGCMGWVGWVEWGEMGWGGGGWDEWIGLCWVGRMGQGGWGVE